VIVAGSTMKGEEIAVLRAFRRVRSTAPNTLLVLAPRNPERFGEAEQLARQEGWKVARRSDLAIDAEPRVDIVVLDTIGELATIYQIATVVFVGGSSVATGGHNVLEPAVFGKPIVFGPHMQNFPRDRRGVRQQWRGRPAGRRGTARGIVPVVDERSGAARPARRGGARAR
jgi:3-deoxy-D-manno-octulosonic-acid transferase